MPGVVDAERALEQADEARARFDVEALITHLSAAIRGFTAEDAPCRAAMACVQLGDVLSNLMGNVTAGHAWFARATRLVADQPPCLEQGWVAVAAMGCEVDDPSVLLERAQLALERARQFGDLNLETKALADGGLAQVQAGRIADGMAMLDEAMALACGPADDVGTAAKSVCSFFTACYHTADVERFGQWSDLLRRHGLIGSAPPGPAFLSSHCDSVQATLLMELGRWTEAEALLVRAITDFEAAMGPAWHPAIALADLRTRQGRLADAEALLLGKDQSMQALLPAARLHLARGDRALAIAEAGRGLRGIGADRLRAVELLTTLLDAHLATGDLDAARATCDDLRARTEGLGVPGLEARAMAARARLLSASGDHDEATNVLAAALDGVDARHLPWLRATLQIELARLHDQAGRQSEARAAAASATASLASLDVVVAAEDAALLDRLGVTAPSGTAAVVAELARAGTWWSASCAGTTVRLRDTKGLRYLAELIGTPGSERHALDLVDRVEGVSSGQPDRRSLGHAGEVLDGAARTAYRHRIEALRADAADALAEGRLEEAEACQVELDLLVAQLAQAFGLGGRSRVAGSAAERARLNVTRAVRAALAKLIDALPEAGATLDRSVRTGLYCAYEPLDGDIRWIVQS
jgi:tetratricopeptide (TPR) repeat protein